MIGLFMSIFLCKEIQPNLKDK